MLEHGMIRGITSSGGGGNAFVAGSYSAGATIDKVNLSVDEASVLIAASMPTGRWGGGSVSTSTKAYVLGGGGGYSAEIDGLHLVDETAINPAAVLSVARGYGVTGASSLSNGYALGGYGTAHTSEIDGIAFTTETAINPSSTLPFVGSYAATRAIPIGSTSAIRVSTNVDTFVNYGAKLVFSTETATTTGTILALARGYTATIWSATNGYNCGGYNGADQTEIDGFNLSTETAINPAAALAAATRGANGLSSSTEGLVCSGVVGAQIRTFNFATEASGTRSNGLTTTRYYVHPMQSSGL